MLTGDAAGAGDRRGAAGAPGDPWRRAAACRASCAHGAAHRPLPGAAPRGSAAGAAPLRQEVGASSLAQKASFRKRISLNFLKERHNLLKFVDTLLIM